MVLPTACQRRADDVMERYSAHGAALHDVDVPAAVDEIESLTTGLSTRMWQRVTILERPALGS